MIETKEWDSNFFGYPIGQYFVKSAKEFDFNKLMAESKKYRLTYVFSDTELFFTNELKLVDTKVIWEKECKEESSFPLKIQEYNSDDHSYDEILNLALLSGQFSRYRVDDKFRNDEFLKLYQEWIRKSISRAIADKIFINLHSRTIAGFITVGEINQETSHIGLLSVAPQFRGRKIASTLINAAVDYSNSRKYKKIQVATQMDNISAMKLYEKNSFSIKSIQYVYHLWNL